MDKGEIGRRVRAIQKKLFPLLRVYLHKLDEPGIESIMYTAVTEAIEKLDPELQKEVSPIIVYYKEDDCFSIEFSRIH